MQKALQIFILFVLLSSPLTFLQAQVPESFNNYHLRLDVGNTAPDSFQVIIMMAIDPSSGPSRLGSSNLQFTFDDAILSNPRYSGSTPPAVYNYSITQPTTNKVSYNLDLTSTGSGGPITQFPAFTEIGRITFDVNAFGAGSFLWTDMLFDTKETVVYFDDEQTLRHPVQMINLENQTFDLDLISFDVNWRTEDEDDAVISWVTATEDGTSTFEIERSFDGTDNWVAIGEVASQGTRTEGAAYLLTDHDVSFQMPDVLAYYRLKENTLAGDVNYSDVLVLQRSAPKGQNFIRAYPNPVADDPIQIDFNISGATDKNVDLQILAIDGRVIYSFIYTPNSSRQLSLQTNDLAAGVYTILVRQGKNNLVEKFVKMPD